MSAVETRLFQMIIAIRDGAKFNLDQLWGDLLPDLHQRPVYLQPFSREQARQAIQHPIKVLGINPVFVDDFLENQLLPDLERLSSRQPAYVLPADLQIVCGGSSKVPKTAEKRRSTTSSISWRPMEKAPNRS